MTDDTPVARLREQIEQLPRWGTRETGDLIRLTDLQNLLLAAGEGAPVSSDCLSASEAVYAFAGWLTCRSERTVMSATDDAAPAANLVNVFCKQHNLADPREGWEKNIVPVKLAEAEERAAQAEKEMRRLEGEWRKESALWSRQAADREGVGVSNSSPLRLHAHILSKCADGLAALVRARPGTR